MAPSLITATVITPLFSHHVFDEEYRCRADHELGVVVSFHEQYPYRCYLEEHSVGHEKNAEYLPR